MRFTAPRCYKHCDGHDTRPRRLSRHRRAPLSMPSWCTHTTCLAQFFCMCRSIVPYHLLFLGAPTPLLVAIHLETHLKVSRSHSATLHSTPFPNDLQQMLNLLLYGAAEVAVQSPCSELRLCNHHSFPNRRGRYARCLGRCSRSRKAAKWKRREHAGSASPCRWCVASARVPSTEPSFGACWWFVPILSAGAG